MNEKRELFEQMLAELPVFSIHLRGFAEGVELPANVKQKSVVLDFGMSLPIPIHDLEIDDDGLRCTLSFGQKPFHCTIPWSAVYLIITRDKHGAFWPNDRPGDDEPAKAPPKLRLIKASQ